MRYIPQFFFKFREHNMELWLIKNKDISDLATSLYHMVMFQIRDMFFNFWQKHEFQHDFLTDYEYMKGKFYILDTLIKFYNYEEHNLKVLLIRNLEVSDVDKRYIP